MRSSPITPTVCTAGSTAKLCQISRYRPARWISSTTIASACCRISTPLGRDRADDAHREARARERLAPHDLLGQAELLADRAHFVLEQVAQRLDELEVHVVGEAADVVVRLDVRVVAAARLDDVGIQRALHEEARVAEIARGFFEHADEQLADDLALALGIDDVVERAEEPVGRLHVHEVDRELARGTSPRPARLRRSRSRPVSTNTHVSWSPIALCTSAAATAESTPPDSPQITRSLPTCARISATACSMIDDVRPRRPAARRVEQERLQDLLAALGVRDLGVELHAVDAAVAVLERGDRDRVGATR